MAMLFFYRSLDRIELKLKEADFAKNREYLRWTLSSDEIYVDDILPEYNIPIDNFWGDLPEGFCEIKKSASKALIEVDNVCFILKSIATDNDPNKVIEYLDDFRFYCREGGGNWSISLPDNIYDEDFIEVVQKHQEIIKYLKDSNAIEGYVFSQKEIEESFINFLCNKLPFDKNSTHSSVIDFDKQNLKVISIKNNLAELSSDECTSVDYPSISWEFASSSKLKCKWKPLRINYGTKSFTDGSEKIVNSCKYISAKCMKAILNKSFGTDF